jgi:hypothetical protein
MPGILSGAIVSKKKKKKGVSAGWVMGGEYSAMCLNFISFITDFWSKYQLAIFDTLWCMYFNEFPDKN